VIFINKLFRVGFVCWFALAQTLLSVSSANAQGLQDGDSFIDVEPPLIEHQTISEVEADTRQSFFATVVDDDELDSVTLFYRFDNDPTYSTALMNRVSYSSTYIAHIPTNPASDRNIEYYIQARDKSGNRTVRGYAFNPLVRVITVTEPSLTAPVASPEQTASTTAKTSGTKKVMYVVLGVLAAGLVAGLAGGSSTTTDNGCPDGQCTVTVTVGAP